MCKAFLMIDELSIISPKCLTSWIRENKNCIKHTVKVTHFERVPSMHKRKEKYKLKLVDIMLTLNELVLLLKYNHDTLPEERLKI